MQKVFIMTSVHTWNDPRIFYRQAYSLAKKFQVELHAPGFTGQKQVEGLKVVGLPLTRRVGRPGQWLRLFWRALHSRADFFHLHDPELLPVGLLLKIILRKTVIYDAHEDYSLTIQYKEWLPAWLRTPVAWLTNKLEKLFSRSLDAVVAATPAIAERFVSCRCAVVCNYPPPLVTTDAVKILDRIPTEKKFTAVYAGGLSVARGIVDLVRAMDITRGIRLLLAGPCSEPDLIKKIEERAGGGDLVYLGKLDPGEIPALLHCADVGLACLHPLPNHIRSLPLKLFEYMAAGLPVVVSDFPLWKEIVGGNICGITVPAGDHQAIAVVLEKMSADPALCRRLGENGYRAWESKYNWRNEERKLFDLYQDLSRRRI